jgi:hypothetical protein
MSYGNDRTPAQLDTLDSLQGDDLVLVSRPGDSKRVKTATVDELFNGRGAFATVGFENADYICDGVDDHVQIQAAIDAGKKTLLFKQGEYNLGASLTNLKGVRLKSIEYQGATINFDGVNMLSPDDGDDVTVDRFVLVGTVDAARTGVVLWETQKTFDFTFRNNLVTTDLVPIVIQNRNEVPSDPGVLIGNTIIEHNDFVGCATSTTVSLYNHESPFDYTARAIVSISGRHSFDDKLEVTHNRIIRGTAATQRPDLNGIYLAGNSTTGIGDIADTRIEGALIAFNYIHTLNRDGIYTSDTFRNKVLFNTVIDVGRAALSCLRAQHQLVEGNYIENVPWVGFRMQNNRWCKWVNNTAINVANDPVLQVAAISMDRGAFNYVSGNTIDTPFFALRITQERTDVTTEHDAEGNRIINNTFLDSDKVKEMVNPLSNFYGNLSDVSRAVGAISIPSKALALNFNEENVDVANNLVFDSSEDRRNATVHGATCVPTGGFNGGGAFSYDGVDDYLSIGNRIVSAVDEFSIDVRIKVNALHSGVIYTDVTNSSNRVFLTVTTGGDVRFRVVREGQPTADKSASDGTLVAGEWHHIVASYKAGVARLRVDNIEYSNLVGQSVVSTTGTNIGRRTDGAAFFNGLIDNLVITLRELSDDEVGALNVQRIEAPDALVRQKELTVSSTAVNFNGKDITNAPNTPTISTGTAAPATTPAKVGDQFIDTANGNIYIAKGTASAADWVQVNN